MTKLIFVNKNSHNMLDVERFAVLFKVFYVLTRNISKTTFRTIL